MWSVKSFRRAVVASSLPYLSLGIIEDSFCPRLRIVLQDAKLILDGLCS
jgi:hypothetical protein